LLHGQLLQALAYNLFAVLALPFLVVWGAQWWWTMFTGKPVRMFALPAWSIRVLLWLMVAFWILRNINVPPFQLLAPHTI
jgi:hypothetical protein